MKRLLSLAAILIPIFIYFAIRKAPVASNANELAMAWLEFPRSVIDSRYAVDAGSQRLENLIHCAPMGFDPSGKLIGDLAKEWQWQSPTELLVSFHTQGLFSDKTPVTLDDIKATYDFFITSNSFKPSGRSQAFQQLEKIEKISDNQLLFTLKKADAAFVTNLVVGVLPQNFAKQDFLSENQTKLPTCGPFSYESSDLNEITLSKNINYSLSNPPKLDKIHIKIIKDASTRFAKLVKNEVQLLQNGTNLEKLDYFKAKKEFSIQTINALETNYMGFNFKDTILSNLPVRQAIAMAINKENIVHFIFNDKAQVANNMLPKNHEFYNPNVKIYEFNILEANRLLDQSGFLPKNGSPFRFQLSYKITTGEMSMAIAKAVASDLEKIGIKVNIEPQEWGKFKSDVEQGLVQLWGMAWVGYKDPSIFEYAFSSKMIPPNGANRGNYKNLTLDEFLIKGATTVDIKERKEIYNKVQEIVAQDLPYIFLVHPESFVIMSSKVKGFQIYADGRYISLKDTSIEL